MDAYKSFCTHLSEKKIKPGREFLKKNETHILPTYIFHSHGRRDNKKNNGAATVTVVLWPAEWRVKEMRTPNEDRGYDNVPPGQGYCTVTDGHGPTVKW